jgi:hypothetical protein
MFNLQEMSISNLGTVIAQFFQYQKSYHPCIILGNVVTSQKIAKFHLIHNCLQLGHFASLRTVNKGASCLKSNDINNNRFACTHGSTNPHFQQCITTISW